MVLYWCRWELSLARSSSRQRNIFTRQGIEIEFLLFLEYISGYYRRRPLGETRIQTFQACMMEFLFCSPSQLPPEHLEEVDSKSSSVSIPQIVESSFSSEQSDSTALSQQSLIKSEPLPFPAAGTTSPSAIRQPRRYSTAIASKGHAKHPAFQGRTVITVPDIGAVLSSPVRRTKMPLARSTPPKVPRSELGQSPEISTSSKTSSTPKRAVAPLPETDIVIPRGVPKPVLHRASTAPTQQDPARSLRIHPFPLRLDAWTEPAAEKFSVRGPNYLSDSVKVPSEAAAFRLLTVDIVQADQPVYTGMCAHPQERIQQAMKRERETGVKELPEFIFAVNLCVPGDKSYHQVSYFGVDNFEEITLQKTAFGRLMHKFIFGESDEFRLQTFKLIPRIVEGNFVVKKAVGTKPTILGRKIKHYFVRGDKYFEVIVDIASDPVAQRIVKLVLGYTKTLVVDMMFLLEAAHNEFLPERVFGGVRLKNIDLRSDGARKLEQP
jgi:Protein ENHANCED DISEASE RESISTANCE 2, C-terminal